MYHKNRHVSEEDVYTAKSESKKYRHREESRPQQVKYYSKGPVIPYVEECAKKLRKEMKQRIEQKENEPYNKYVPEIHSKKEWDEKQKKHQEFIAEQERIINEKIELARCLENRRNGMKTKFQIAEEEAERQYQIEQMNKCAKNEHDGSSKAYNNEKNQQQSYPRPTHQGGYPLFKGIDDMLSFLVDKIARENPERKYYLGGDEYDCHSYHEKMFKMKNGKIPLPPKKKSSEFEPPAMREGCPPPRIVVCSDFAEKLDRQVSQYYGI